MSSKHFTKKSKAKQDIPTASLPDIIFMLLIFFVWTASFHAAELILPSSLVTQNQGQGSVELDPELLDLERVVVRITWNGTRPGWIVNDAPLPSLVEVRDRLQSVAGIKTSLPVLVDPMPLVPLEHVIDVYDGARYAGFENVQFAAETQPRQ